MLPKRRYGAIVLSYGVLARSFKICPLKILSHCSFGALCVALYFRRITAFASFAPATLGSLNISILVSSVQNFLSFYFLHFLCIFSEDDATFGKEISRPNLSFFLISFKKIRRKQKRLARILLHEKRRKRRKMPKNKGFWQG